MKRLTFKKPFNGMDNALKLIPESYKVDGQEFQITDGTETYNIRWDINEATVLIADNKNLISEDVKKMKHLMNFKSQDTLGTLKGDERINENSSFNDVWSKTKDLLNESEEINEMTSGSAGGLGFTGEGNLEGNTPIKEMESEEKEEEKEEEEKETVKISDSQMEKLKDEGICDCDDKCLINTSADVDFKEVLEKAEKMDKECIIVSKERMDMLEEKGECGCGKIKLKCHKESETINEITRTEFENNASPTDLKRYKRNPYEFGPFDDEKKDEKAIEELTLPDAVDFATGFPVAMLPFIATALGVSVAVAKHHLKNAKSGKEAMKAIYDMKNDKDGDNDNNPKNEGIYEEAPGEEATTQVSVADIRKDLKTLLYSLNKADFKAKERKVVDRLLDMIKQLGGEEDSFSPRLSSKLDLVQKAIDDKSQPKDATPDLAQDAMSANQNEEKDRFDEIFEDMYQEELSKKQSEVMDTNNDGKIDAEDLANLRNKK